jgi:pentatricopeptide repeat protein
MRAAGVWPTAPGLQHLLMACARAGVWRSALAALRDAEASPPAGAALATNVRHWNAVLKACVTAGEVREAERLLEEMACRANASSFNTLALLADAKARGVGLGAATYAKAVRTLWWAKLPTHAQQLAASMEAAGVAPDHAYFQRVTLAAESVGLLDEADQLHREAQRRGLAASPPRSAAPPAPALAARDAETAAALDLTFQIAHASRRHSTDTALSTASEHTKDGR